MFWLSVKLLDITFNTVFSYFWNDAKNIYKIIKSMQMLYDWFVNNGAVKLFRMRFFTILHSFGHLWKCVAFKKKTCSFFRISCVVFSLFTLTLRILSGYGHCFVSIIFCCCCGCCFWAFSSIDGAKCAFSRIIHANKKWWSMSFKSGHCDVTKMPYN